MVVRAHPNENLRALLVQAGWSGQELARAVNAAGAEAGVDLRYDRSAVSHWLAGVQPRRPAPGLIAEVLSRRLGRELGIGDLGLGSCTHQLCADDGQGDLMAALERLAGIHADGPGRRRVLGTMCAYSLGALTIPAWADLAMPPVVSAAADRRAVSPEAVAGAEAIAQALAVNDAAFGGGNARRATAAYLAHDLAPRLGAPASPKVRQRLHLVAGQLAYLCGFMCFDDDLHGLAQQYYLIALRFAAEIGDRTGYAVTLRALSVQARSLGHRRQAVQLAESATAACTAMDPGRQAFMYGQLAVAHAADGDRHTALTCLSAAERRLERATCMPSPLVGAYHPASLAHQQAAVQALLGDHKGAISALAASVRHRPATERRFRAITLARLAELQLRHGHLEEAAGTWNHFLDDYPYLTSHRVTAAHRTMRAMLRPYNTHPSARALLARAVESSTSTAVVVAT